MDKGLVTAAFSAILGTEVILPDHPDAANKELKRKTVHDLFRLTHNVLPPIIPESATAIADNDKGKFQIHVKTLTGQTASIPVSKHHSVRQIKEAIAAHSQLGKVQTHRQRLVFNGRALQDDDTVHGMAIPPNGMCYMIVLGGEDATDKFVLHEGELDPQYDYDFTNESDDGQAYDRGGYPYHRPYGWMRFAVRVLGRSEYGGNNIWLGTDGIRTDTNYGEWPVSYHGTDQPVVPNIIDEGLRKGWRTLHGPGVYSSPYLRVAADYASTFIHNGKSYKVVLQNRVCPENVKTQTVSCPTDSEERSNYANCSFVIVPGKFTNPGLDYWRCPRHDPSQGIYDIRPYGILIREA